MEYNKLIYVVRGYDVRTGETIKPFVAFDEESDAEKYCGRASNKHLHYNYDKVWLNYNFGGCSEQ